MLVLFECAAGYAVFKVFHISKQKDKTEFVNDGIISIIYRHVVLCGQ